MNPSLFKGLIAQERLPSAHVNVGFCNFCNCVADFYFYIFVVRIYNSSATQIKKITHSGVELV